MNGPYKQSVADWAVVRIENATGTGVTGIAWNAAALSFRLAKNGAAGAAKALSGAGDWVEQANGYYWVRLTATDLNTVGPALLIVVYDGVELGVPFRVFTNTVDDVKTETASIKAKTDNLPANPASQTNLDVAVSTRLAAASYTAPDNAGITAIKAKTDNLPANPASQTNLDVAVSTRLATAGYTAPDNAGIAAIQAKTDALPADPASEATVLTRLAAADYVAPSNADIAAIKAKTDNLPANPASQTNLDVAVSTRLATAGYTAPDNAGITAIKAKTDNLPADPASQANLDVPVSTRLAAADYVVPIAPDNAGIAAIQAKTDTLPASPANEVTVAAVKTVVDANLDATVSSRLAAAGYTAPNNAGIATIQAKTDALPASPANEVTVAAVKAQTDNIPRLLGLHNDNTVMDQQVFVTINSKVRLQSARVRCYDSAVNAAAAGATGLLFTYTVAAEYDVGGNITSYKMLRS